MQSCGPLNSFGIKGSFSSRRFRRRRALYEGVIENDAIDLVLVHANLALARIRLPREASSIAPPSTQTLVCVVEILWQVAIRELCQTPSVRSLVEDLRKSVTIVSMPAVDVDDEPFVDPDELKVPESPEHRRVAELIAVAAELQMVDSSVYRDMNWYPLDGGTALAPDVMTLPAGTLAVGAKSYRQLPAGPLPGVVVEVPSKSDGITAFLAKTSRCQRLGVVVYMVTVDDGFVGVVRMAGVGTDYVHWTGRPIPELGNICIDVEDGEIVIRSATNQVFRRAADMVSDANERAADANQRASDATKRAAALEAQLRGLGIEPLPAD
jgi:hypothetical protein